MNARRAALALAASLLVPGLASAATPARRIALVVGANRAGADRVPLRWAVADAERFAALLTEMGGVAPADCIVLREPTRRALLDGLAVVRGRAGEPRAGDGRTEVVVYYSGHADEQGLLLGRETLSYRELKDAMHGISADVGIGILDACASGVITRLKGGRLQPGFLTDESMQMKGYAFLTSSSENEAAQESERIKGSYFTSALRHGPARRGRRVGRRPRHAQRGLPVRVPARPSRRPPRRRAGRSTPRTTSAWRAPATS